MILLQDVPAGYDYCFAGMDKCPRAATCLRAIAAKLLSESEERQPMYVHAVSPLYVNRLSELSACGCYRSCERYFYLSRKGERLISPTEQQRIADVFKTAGSGDKPKFDGYEYQICW